MTIVLVLKLIEMKVASRRHANEVRTIRGQELGAVRVALFGKAEIRQHDDATANGGIVTMEHLIHATRREYQKMGRGV